MTGFQSALEGTLRLSWGFSDTNPRSSAADATLPRHTDGGTLTLELSDSPAYAITSSDQHFISLHRRQSGLEILQEYQKMIKAHATMFGLAFLVFLPLGALVARLTRTFNPFWFKVHWIIQFYIGACRALRIRHS